jgi:uncharacterized Zn finger protein (UPF0148 family)
MTASERIRQARELRELGASYHCPHCDRETLPPFVNTSLGDRFCPGCGRRFPFSATVERAKQATAIRHSVEGRDGFSLKAAS